MTDNDLEAQVNQLLARPKDWAWGATIRRELVSLSVLLGEKSKFYSLLSEKVDRALGKLDAEEERKIKEEIAKREQIRMENLNRDPAAIDEQEEQAEKLKAALMHYKTRNAELSAELEKLKFELSPKD